MLNRNFFLGALLALSVSFLVAFSSAKTESNAVYEYVTLTQVDFTEVNISEHGKALRTVKIEAKPKSIYDFNVVYGEINKYEAAGWELFSTYDNAVLGNPKTAFLLRRKKQ